MTVATHHKLIVRVTGDISLAAKKHQNHEHQNDRGQNDKNQSFKPGTITLTNGKQIECHHSHQFDDADFRLFTPKPKKTLINERHAAKRNNQGRGRGSKQRPGDWKKELQKEGTRIVSSLTSQLKDSDGFVSALTQQNDTPPTPPGLPSSIVGGRNSQAWNEGGQTE